MNEDAQAYIGLQMMVLLLGGLWEVQPSWNVKVGELLERVTAWSSA